MYDTVAEYRKMGGTIVAQGLNCTQPLAGLCGPPIPSDTPHVMIVRIHMMVMM